MNADEVLKKLMEYYKVDNIADLGKKIAIPLSTLYAWKRRNFVDMYRIAEVAPNIDIAWLLGKPASEVMDDMYNNSVSDFIGREPTTEYYADMIAEDEKKVEELKSNSNIQDSVQNEIAILEAKIQTLKDFIKR